MYLPKYQCKCSKISFKKFTTPSIFPLLALQKCHNVNCCRHSRKICCTKLIVINLQTVIKGAITMVSPTDALLNSNKRSWLSVVSKSI